MANRKTVLIADDDRILVGALKARCKRLGVDVVTAYDTLAAVLKIKEVLPDVLCLDLNLPGGCGLNICEMLTFDAQKKILPLIEKAIPIIALTGRTDPETINTCQELGAYYVPKGGNLWARIEPLLRQLLGINPADANKSRTEMTEIPASIDKPDNRNPDLPADMEKKHKKKKKKPNRLSPNRMKKLLVIEDDFGVVQIVRNYVGQTRFQVLHCDNLEDARQLAESASVVLCDVHMPRDRGTFMIRELREHGYGGPVVVITGDSTRTTVMECVRASVDDILLKPFSRKELLEKLEKVLGELDGLPVDPDKVEFVH